MLWKCYFKKYDENHIEIEFFCVFNLINFSFFVLCRKNCIIFPASFTRYLSTYKRSDTRILLSIYCCMTAIVLCVVLCFVSSNNTLWQPKFIIIHGLRLLVVLRTTYLYLWSNFIAFDTILFIFERFFGLLFFVISKIENSTNKMTVHGWDMYGKLYYIYSYIT